MLSVDLTRVHFSPAARQGSTETAENADTGRSWAYHGWRSIFEASHRESSRQQSIADSSQDHSGTGSDDNNASDKAETDSEMTMSSNGENAQNADDNSLPPSGAEGTAARSVPNRASTLNQSSFPHTQSESSSTEGTSRESSTLDGAIGDSGSMPLPKMNNKQVERVHTVLTGNRCALNEEKSSLGRDQSVHGSNENDDHFVAQTSNIKTAPRSASAPEQLNPDEHPPVSVVRVLPTVKGKDLSVPLRGQGDKNKRRFSKSNNGSSVERELGTIYIGVDVSKNSAKPHAMDTTTYLLSQLEKNKSTPKSSLKKHRKSRKKTISPAKLKPPPQSFAASKNSAEFCLKTAATEKQSSVAKAGGSTSAEGTAPVHKMPSLAQPSSRSYLWRGSPRHLDLKKMPPSPNIFLRDPFDETLTEKSSNEQLLKDVATSKPTIEDCSDRKMPAKARPSEKRGRESMQSTGPGNRKPFRVESRQKLRLLYTTCRDKVGADVLEIQRTIAVRDATYFYTPGATVQFVFTILSMDTAMMSTRFEFEITFKPEMNLREVRENVSEFITSNSHLDETVLWEFFLPNAGFYIKHELESFFPLRDYMDESGAGARIAIRIVKEYEPAVCALTA